MKKGFTLVEMMVVVGIIGLLAVAATMSFSQQRAISRDAKRKRDVNNIAKGMELLYEQTGSYAPDGSEAGYIDTSIGLSINTTTDGSWGSSDWDPGSDVRELQTYNIMDEIPVDPINKNPYYYKLEMDDELRGYFILANKLEVTEGNTGANNDQYWIYRGDIIEQNYHVD